MLQVYISPIRVEKVVFLAEDDPDREEADLYCYQAIRPLLDKITWLLTSVAQEIAQEWRDKAKAGEAG